ncbi:MAG: HEAT repeat domain-containing protein [Planctomycetota bacterium]|nr:HEAT repeat domain-containing protein [Planctomycetota bacterium]
MGRVFVFGLLAALAAAAPARHLRYAESANRLVYAYVFGSKDTCRVVRRTMPPRFELEQILRRPPGAAHRPAADEKLVAEFNFGRLGRPVHLVPTNDAHYLLSFANRAPFGEPPKSDDVWNLRERHDAPRLEYADLADPPPPGFPDVPRALSAPKDKPLAARESANYAFETRALTPTLLFVARLSEAKDGFRGELVGFMVDIPKAKARVPDPDDALTLLDDPEPVVRAAAAWALGRRARKKDAAALRGVLGRATAGLERAVIASALIACGAQGARKTLRALLEGSDANGRREAAAALLRAGPTAADADGFAACLTSDDPYTVAVASRAIVRCGKPGARALVKLSRHKSPEIRALAAKVLGRCSEPEAERRLMALGREADAGVLRAVALALTRPPRKPLDDNVAAFARVLDNVRRQKHDVAARRLSVLAAHAEMKDDKVLAALVELAPIHERAMWALSKLVGREFKTPDECRQWWKTRAN